MRLIYQLLVYYLSNTRSSVGRNSNKQKQLNYAIYNSTLTFNTLYITDLKVALMHTKNSLI